MTSELVIEFQKDNETWVGHFQCMANPCEIHLRMFDETKAKKILTQAQSEAQRIEKKFSRYRDDNLMFQINQGSTEVIEVDSEWVQLLNLADTLYDLSDGLFDITCGVLRKIWNFKDNNKIPSATEIELAISNIGWNKVLWQPPFLTMQAGMEIDLGGIGKEYAVDQVAQVVKNLTGHDFLVNFGGDCCCHAATKSWHVGIESKQQQADFHYIKIKHGAVATSGTTKQFIQKNNQRYGHILNPLTGKPIEMAPLSVTVISETCLNAGALATLAMLQGENAESFLDAQEVEYFCQR